MPNLKAVEDASGKVQDTIQDNIIRLVSKSIIIHGKSDDVVNMGRIYAYETDNYKIHIKGYQNKNYKYYNNVNNLKLHKGKDAVGLISLEFGNDEAHWAAYYYDHTYIDNSKKTKGIFVVYDSMQKPMGKLSWSKHSVKFKNILQRVYGTKNNPFDVKYAGCRSCAIPITGIAAAIRPARVSRQPSGGFLKDSIQNQLNVAINKNEKPSDNLRKNIGSYKAQHHFCFVEALMFIDHMLTGSIPNSCKTGSVNGKKELIEIKTYARNLMNGLGEKTNDDFNNIYDPVSGKKISMNNNNNNPRWKNNPM